MPQAKTVEELKDRSIAVAKGSTLDIWLTDNAPGARLVRFEDTPSAVAASSGGPVRVLRREQRHRAQVADDNPARRRSSFLIRQSPAHAAVQQGQQNLLNWINTFLFYNRLNGKLPALQTKWFAEAQTLPQMSAP